MSMDFVAYLPGQYGVHEFYETLEEAQAEADAMTDATGARYEAALFDDWHREKMRGYVEAGPLREITEDAYYDALNVLPPMYRKGAMGFFMCEYLAGTVTDHYAVYDGRYFTKTVDMGDRSTWITPEKIREVLA